MLSFNSSVEFSPATTNMLCVVIESTCGAVIDVESANCCGATVELQTVSRVRLALFERVSKEQADADH